MFPADRVRNESNMLDIYILEHNVKLFDHLKDICFRYLMVKNLEAEIYEFSDDRLPASAALYILEICGNTEAVSRRLHSLNKGSYIIVRLNDYKELTKAVTPGICPSGVLVYPCEKDDVEAVLDEIYADYMRCSSENSKLGMFSFRQKAREFSIPFEKIILFESRNKKVLIRTEAQEFEVYETLDAVSKRLPDCFMKIHKSFVINLSRVVSADYGAMEVELDDGSAAYMSRTYKSELRERLKGRSGDNCSQHT